MGVGVCVCVSLSTSQPLSLNLSLSQPLPLPLSLNLSLLTPPTIQRADKRLGKDALHFDGVDGALVLALRGKRMQLWGRVLLHLWQVMLALAHSMVSVTANHFHLHLSGLCSCKKATTCSQ